MSRAFVLGNGRSRQDLDLALIAAAGPIYGCNALYRDYIPTTLVATDRPIAEHIQSLGIARQTKFYTRKPQPGTGAFRVPQKYFGFSSGPIAVALAAQDRRPHHLCGYLFETAGMFHRFFEACPVLQAPTPELRNSRLALAGLTGDILRDGLGILGIPTLEEM
jgi:hypothetical protein